MDYDFLSYDNSFLKNMQFYRQNLPSINKKDGIINLSTTNNTIKIGEIEEPIFLIIAEYTFMPIWLVEKFISNNPVKEDIKKVIKSWLDIDIIWIDKNIAGEFIRPTYLLYEFLNKKNNRFTQIPFNMLTKYIVEQNIIFETMLGINNPINKTLKHLFLKKYSPFGLEKTKGTNIIYNSQIVSPKALKISGYENIENINRLVIENDKQGRSYEFKDFRAWTIIKKENDLKDINKDFKLHSPDLIIPSTNKNSIAIEIELANRGVKHYYNILNIFKENKIYKNIVFLCSSFTIYSNIRLAYEDIKREGEMLEDIYLFDLDIPSIL